MHLIYEKPAYLASLRELVRCDQAFERFSTMHVRLLGLTLPQFDVIATLGNTEGMTCGELGEKTLITKGTLTGVLDRMEQRGLITRKTDTGDARRMFVALTEKGQQLFVDAFPAHLAHLNRAFSRVPPAQLQAMLEGLHALREAFEHESVGGDQANLIYGSGAN